MPLTGSGIQSRIAHGRADSLGPRNSLAALCAELDLEKGSKQ
jgi:hypothetical protein